VLGYQPSDLLGRAALDLVHPDERGAVARDFQRMHETSWGREFEMRVRHQDGSWRWFECSGNAFRVPTGEKRAVIISRDVTERKQAQLQQEKLEAQMLQTQKLESLGVMAGGIAHDFKNLLVPVLGNAHLAKQELTPDSPVVPLVERIAKAAERTSELTDQLLAYAGRGTLTTCPLDLRELLREMGELLHAAVSRGTELAYELPDALPFIEGDAVQLRQVVLNLIINASEAIGDRPGVVTIGAGTSEVDRARVHESYLGGELADGTYVYLEVSDDGCGMDQETRSKIFDPFFTTKFTGRGLGLAALLGIVRGHRGAVRVESEPGRGTRFRLLFPVGSGSPATPEKTGPCALAWRGSGTVLVGDDEASVLKFTEHVLRGCGLCVITAESGQKAVELFREHAPKIAAVVLDVTMPGLGGVEAVVEIRKVRPDVPILLSSGYSEADVASRLPGGEVDGFLQKPYAPEALVRKLRKLLEA
jgi:two-component system cell cycle sensor histidine kinase/response regulator CckA